MTKANLTSSQNALNLSMPWVLHSPRGMRWALSQSHVRTPTLSSFDISGYRGSPAALKGLLALCQGSIKRFVFDCPIEYACRPCFCCTQLINLLVNGHGTTWTKSSRSLTFTFTICELNHILGCRRGRGLNPRAALCGPGLWPCP